MLEPARLTELLARQPEEIAELTRGRTDAELAAEPVAGGWSVSLVLAHLRACADVWGGCAERILREDVPVLRAVNPRRWIAETDYPRQPFGRSFAAFRRQRGELLARLDGLRPEDWGRSATLLGAGRPLQRTVRTYLDRLATHERAHLRQIRRLTAGEC